MKRIALIILSLMMATNAFALPQLSGDAKLNPPFNKDGGFTGKSTEIYPPRLVPPFLTEKDGRLVFESPSECAKTSTRTEYCRMEARFLRNFSLNDATFKMRAKDVRVEYLPCGTRAVDLQIHGVDDEVFRGYVDNPANDCGNLRVYFINDKAGKTGKETTFVLKDGKGNPLIIKIGESIDYLVTLNKKKIRVAAVYNGVKYSAQDTINAFWLIEKNNKFYPKGGVYFQTKVKGLKAIISFGKIKEEIVP